MAAKANPNLGDVDRGDSRRGGDRAAIPGSGAKLPPVHRIRHWALNFGGCHLAAAMVCAILLFPTLLIVLDRTPPFHFVHGEITPHSVRAGEDATIIWTINEPRKLCPGVVKRTLIDSTGTVFVMADVPTAYTEVRVGQRFARTFTLPKGMASGPATYRAQPYYVCNWFDRWLPIKGLSPVVTFNVVN